MVATILDDQRNPAYKAHELLVLPRFQYCLHSAAELLLATHKEIPREVRYMADLKKWMLSHATFALHFTGKLSPEAPRLTPGALTEILAGTGIVSRNTVTAFLQEMQYYGLASPVNNTDKRRRALAATPFAEALISRWFSTQAKALDRVDSGQRSALLASDPELIRVVQPAMFEAILLSPSWFNPPPSVAMFTWAESGSNVLHHIMYRAPRQLAVAQFDAGRITAKDIAGHYMISATHTARLLNQAEQRGYLSWPSGWRGGCIVSKVLLQDYRQWQAAKFAALSKSFSISCGQQ